MIPSDLPSLLALAGRQPAITRKTRRAPSTSLAVFTDEGESRSTHVNLAPGDLPDDGSMPIFRRRGFYLDMVI
ncbi:hypothetical protein [Acetobacter estunensis]|uniref:hypothetical protein n=1 Tax=Acetobacter estunensis TaxID=104097 RepID=UPI001C2D0CB3|nr:hypothetical protein [Acetobacter estunensis]MBV1836532.1 hypothetical protein [Acetobacter estunensis]